MTRTGAAVAALAAGVVLASWTPALADEPTYVGVETCVTCHEDKENSLKDTHHASAGFAKLSSHGCESCHGPGSAHIDDPENVKPPIDFEGKGAAAEQKVAACLSCHGGERHLAFWDSGKHSKNDVSCSDCHSIHGSTTDPSIAPYRTTQRKLEYETCTECHQNIRTQLSKNSHHPIQEGKVTCSDCHNPHGALSPAMVKNESTNQLCASCHVDKRGPFVWAHMPVEENCLSCHNSHGSNVPKLLTVKVPQLCQDCHGSAHGQYAYGSSFAIGGANQSNASRFDSRSCVNCHQMIHGSNAPASRGHFLLR